MERDTYLSTSRTTEGMAYLASLTVIASSVAANYIFGISPAVTIETVLLGGYVGFEGIRTRIRRHQFEKTHPQSANRK